MLKGLYSVDLEVWSRNVNSYMNHTCTPTFHNNKNRLFFDKDHIFPDDTNPYMTIDLAIEGKKKYFINTLKCFKSVSNYKH